MFYRQKQFLWLFLTIVFSNLGLFSQTVSHQFIINNFNSETFNIYHYLPENYLLQLINKGNNPYSSFRIYEIAKDKKNIDGCKLSVVIAGNKALVTLVLPDSNAVFFKTTGNFEFWKNKGNEWYPVTTKISITERHKFLLFTEVNNRVRFDKEDVRIYSKKDSLITLKIFTPDPLSPSARAYAYPYTDRQDSTYPQIENEKTWQKARFLLQNDTFLLKDDYLSFSEISNPLTVIPIFKSDFIQVTRNQPAFEYLNVFFHLQKVRSYWNAMGLGYLADTVTIDPHALGGADESSFDRTHQPPAIEFGDGGVDDAEDADAIIHEYTHAACQSIVANGYTGIERQSVEEGICDFSAAVYSLLFTQNFKGQVYNWDGHNEYWNGRTLVNARKYPNDKTGQVHIDGQLFGGALWDIGTAMGFDSCLKLVFLSLPAMLPNIGMKEAATAIIQTDSLLFGGRNFALLDKVFSERGLWQSKLNTRLTVPDTKHLFTAFYDAPSNHLVINNGGTATPCRIIDPLGRIVDETPLVTGQNRIAISLRSGIYIINTPQKAITVLIP